MRIYFMCILVHQIMEVIDVSWTDRLRMESLLGAGKSHQISDEMVDMDLEDQGYEVYY